MLLRGFSQKVPRHIYINNGNFTVLHIPKTIQTFSTSSNTTAGVTVPFFSWMMFVSVVCIVAVSLSGVALNRKEQTTRMHSSRMRSIRCCDHRGGGECLPGGVCLGVST